MMHALRFSSFSVLIPRVLVCVFVLAASVSAAPTEQELREGFDEAVKLVSTGKFAEGRKKLDAIEAAAREVKSGDPAYKQAQNLLKQSPQLRLNSFHNSFVASAKASEDALQNAKVDEATKHFEQAVADLAELVRLRPADKGDKDRLAAFHRKLAHARLLEMALAGKAVGESLAKEAALQEPKILYQSAPAFSLPLSDRPGLIAPFDEPGTVILVQLWSAAGKEALLAHDTLTALHTRYAARGLRAVSVSFDEGENLKTHDEFRRAHSPKYAATLDDHGEFRQQYLQNNYNLPSYVLIGRDRRALWISHSDALETIATMAQQVSEELAKPGAELPHVTARYFAPAEPIRTLAGGQKGGLVTAGKPALLLVTSDKNAAPFVKDLAALADQHGGKLQVAVVIPETGRGVGSEFVAEKSCTVVSVESLPAGYNRRFQSELIVVSRGGRILKSAVLGRDEAHTRELLRRYAEILVSPELYPVEADAPKGANLALRALGGSVESISLTKQPGTAARLIDGVCGGEGWKTAESVPQNVVLSFLDRQPATFSRIVVDRRSGAGEFEVLAGDDARGSFRSLGKFRFEQREGRQAFNVPRTQAKYLKLVFHSLLADERGKPELEIGEIAVHEAAQARPLLAERLAAFHQRAAGFADDFSDEGLKFWEQTDYVSDERPAEWRVEKGWLTQSGADRIRDPRASALLHGRGTIADFRLQTVLKGNSQMAGVVFAFEDWDNFSRLVLVRGHVDTRRSEGNSIRLERWRDGRLEVLGVHGEAYPWHDPIRLEIVRQGPRLAVKAQDQVIFSLDGVAAATGRIGLCAGGGGELEVDEFRVTPLAATTPWSIAPLNPLSTAAGASIVWLNRQGTDQQPEMWASNLLRTPVFAPLGAWEAAVKEGEPPEVVFAFRDNREVLLEAVQFELPQRTGAEAKNLARKIEVLVSRDGLQRPESFRSVGAFTLTTQVGPQNFELTDPAACRYLMLRLLENAGGDRACLGHVNVRLGKEPPTPLAVRVDRAEVEKRFELPSDASEREPNDEAASATRLAAGKTLEAALGFGELDWFRLPDPPEGKGMRTLRLQLEALPWLRLSADVTDAEQRPLAPSLVKYSAGQRVELARRIGPGVPVPALVRVEMPAVSLGLVLDTSNSMGGREADLRNAVGEYLKGAGETEQVEVIHFGTQVQVLGRLPPGKTAVAEAVSRLGVAGNTALYEALLKAAEGNQAVVLLSDGMNTVFNRDFTDLCRELRRRPIPIYVIGVGWDLYEFDRNSGNTAIDLLRNLAVQTGGRFYFSPSSEQLTELYRQIAADVRGQTRYRLRAEWEVIERQTELAVLPASATKPILALPALPAAEPELVASGPAKDLLSLGGTVLPPAPELTPLPPRENADQVALVHLPIPLDLELAPSTPIKGPRAAQTPLPVAAELYSSLPEPLSGRIPLSPGLPEFGQVEVIYVPPRGGPALPPAVMPATELILDASDSMKEVVGRETKLQVAQQVVTSLIDATPNDARLGLRLYGHWGILLPRRTDPKAAPLAWEDPRLNTDSELVSPIGPLNAAKRKHLKDWVAWAKPRGKTPLVYSLREAKRDFPDQWKGPKIVILVTDGVETCGGKISDLKALYGESDVRAVVHVVGFDIRGAAAEQQLREIAGHGGGEYYHATDAKKLAEALRSALVAGVYSVYDESSAALVATGVVRGPPISLSPGKYRLSLRGVDVPPISFTVADGAALKLNLNEDGTLKLP